MVFSFDEKTQCQALDRTQPSLPMKSGRAGSRWVQIHANDVDELLLEPGIVAHLERVDFPRLEITGQECSEQTSI